MKNESKTYEEKAKLLFFKYNGSFFQMERENEYDNYKRFNISKDLEAVWFVEISLEKIEEISALKDESKIVQILAQLEQLAVASKNDSITQIIINSFKEKIYDYDSFTKIRFSETILNIQERLGIVKLDKIMYDFIKKSLKEVIKNPENISKYNKENGAILDYMTIDKLIPRATNNLKRLESFEII